MLPPNSFSFSLSRRAPPSIDWVGWWGSVTPSEDAVSGISSVSPWAPAALPTVGSKWDSCSISPASRLGLRPYLAQAASIDSKSVEKSLSVLGTQGVVGFDLAERAYFQRELPFAIDLIEKYQSRLEGARELAANTAVTDVTVPSSGPRRGGSINGRRARGYVFKGNSSIRRGRATRRLFASFGIFPD